MYLLEPLFCGEGDGRSNFLWIEDLATSPMATITDFGPYRFFIPHWTTSWNEYH